MNATDQVKRDEGLQLTAYPDPLTGADPWTIGYGCTGPGICQGVTWTSDKADQELTARLAQIEQELTAHFPWFSALTVPRQAGLMNMTYQMGLAGLSTFIRFLECMRDGRYEEAETHLLNSLWARQTPVRARRVAHQISSGEWQ